MANEELLHADATAIEAAGNKFVEQANVKRDALNRLASEISGLRGSFQGSAAETLYARFEAMSKVLDNEILELDELGQELKLLAQKVRDIQLEARGLFEQ